MTFRFKQSDETAEAGVRRIACAQIDEALATIEAENMPMDRIVHDVRRRCKAVRALIRLVRPVFPGYAHENAVFRDIARGLAHMRDSMVLADTLDALTGERHEGMNGPAIALLRTRLIRGADVGSARETIEHSAGQLLAARVRAESWFLTADGWDALSGGLTATYRRARRGMKEMARKKSAQLSHEWRKQVKYHWHHLRLLRDIAPREMKKRAGTADRLGELLGDRHDLDLLIEALAAQPQGDDWSTAEGVMGIAAERAAKLDRKAIRLGERLFDETPRRLMARWRDEPASFARPA